MSSKFTLFHGLSNMITATFDHVALELYLHIMFGSCFLSRRCS